MKYLRLTGIFLFVFILWQVDWGEAVGIISGMDAGALIIACLINIAITIAKAWRWHWLMRMQKVSLSFKDALKIYLSAYYYGALTPGRLGEILKVFYVKRYGGTSAAVGLSSVLTDRLMDIYTSFVLGCLGLYFLDLLGPLNWLGLFIPAVSVVFLGVMLNRRVAMFLIDRLSRILLLRRISIKADALVREFTEATLELIKPGIWLPVLITLITYAVFFYGCLLIAGALGVQIPYRDIAFFVSIGTIIAIIPISIAGLGTRDAILILLFARIGTGQDAAVSFSLLLFVTFTVLLGLLGYVAWLLTPLDKPGKDELQLDRLQRD